MRLLLVCAAACTDRATVGEFHEPPSLPAQGDGIDASPPFDAPGRETPLDLQPVTTPIAAGGQSTCAIDKGGGALCWGDNLHGQLGAGSMDPKKSATPLHVKGLAKGVRAVAGGQSAHCAILEDGGARCWGYSVFGQFAGTGSAMDFAQFPYPHDHTGLSNDIAEIAFGFRFACALTRAGRPKCWGFGGTGQLGNGGSGDSPVAGDVAIGTERFVHLSAAMGGQYACAAAQTGKVFCWGQNNAGQLGTGDERDRALPTEVKDLGARAIGIGAGRLHTCAILEDRAVTCWGKNDRGQLGSRAGGAAPRPVDGLSGVTQLSVGNAHACALVASGAVICWGSNEFGAMSPNGPTILPATTFAEPAFGAIGVAAGGSHTCVLNAARHVRCVGANSESQLGPNGGDFDL